MTQPASSSTQQTQPVLSSTPTTQHPTKEATETSSTPKVITVVDMPGGEKLQIVDEPIPAECNAHPNLDIDGYAVKWGLDHKTRSAAECCQRCMQMLNETKPCHAWVWCGDPSGVCWTPDIHNHTTGACWLKHQETWDGITDLTKSNLTINFQGAFADTFREEHKTAPKMVPWTAGLVKQLPKPAAGSTAGGTASSTAGGTASSTAGGAAGGTEATGGAASSTAAAGSAAAPA